MPYNQLLITDVDDTLIGDAAALDVLLERLTEAGTGLVLNSARSVITVLSHRVVADLPVAATIGALGTEIDYDGVYDRAWHADLAAFPRGAVEDVLDEFGPPRALEFQALAKVSHTIPRAQWPAVIQRIYHVDPRLRVLTSGESDVDVIPMSAGKANAAQHAAQQLGVPWHRVTTAGAAEVDAEMLIAGKGIAVGNATARMLEMVAGRAYQATATYASGVMEGLDYFELVESKTGS